MFSLTMPSLRQAWLAALLLATLPLTSAQVTTDCNPMEKKCPDNPALGIEHHFHFNSSPPLDTWEKTAAGEITYDPDKGAIFKLNKQGDSPTLRTKFYFFGGRTEMMMKCAPGRGIISSMMWLSDTLDEVDWEFFGTNDTHAASNYFGKGEEDFGNGEYHPTGFNIYDDYHNYTTIWTEKKLEWWIDGELVRTLVPDDAQGGKHFPQSPMRLSLGIWAGGDPRLAEGTQQWAGGTTNFDDGPFEMYVKSVKVTDYSTDAEKFVHTDRDGMWDSIKVVEGNSTAREAIFKEPEKSLNEKWNDLPQAARVAVYAGGAAVAAILIFIGLFYFIRQRRRGAREAAAAAAAAEQERLELQGLKGGGDYSVAEREKFDGMGAKPDNSWPEERGGLLSDVPMSPGPNSGFAAPPGYAPPGPASPTLGGYDAPGSPGMPPRSASAAPMGYAPPGAASPSLGYEGPVPRSASAAPEGYGYGGQPGQGWR